MRTKLRSKFTLLFMTVALVLAVPAVALADNLQGDDLEAGANATKAPGDTGTAKFNLVSNGSDGCNVDGSNPATVTVSSNQSWLTIDSPGSVQITACGTGGAKTLGYSVSSTAPDGAIATVSGVASGGKSGNNGYNNTPGKFTVTVDAPADADGDGVLDASDNCVDTANADQADTDADGVGDACDTQDNGDTDSDGVENYQDNCPTDANADQDDLDADGIGDVCDPDVDGDTVDNGDDNCPLEANADQADVDNDGVGTVCDPDETPPVIDYDLDPAAPDGSNGWYKSDVTLTWSVTDPESAAVKTGCVDQNITADQAEQTYSCSATSDGGSAGPVEVKIKRDGSAPEITDAGAKSAPNGTNGWYTTEAFNKWTASDSPSGLADTTKASFEVGTGTREGSDLTVESGPVSDNAGNSAASETSAASFDVDLSNPYDVAFAGGPAAGSSHYFGSVPAAPTCTAKDDVSGLKDCKVTGYGTTVGPHTMTATATDNAGRTATATRSYTVDPYALNGFFQPVDMGLKGNTNLNTSVGSATPNAAKAGQTVPLKFEIFSGTTELTDTSQVKTLVQQVNCSATSGAEDLIENYATGGTTLRYDTTGGQFIFNWQTPKNAGSCYKVTMTAQDNSFISAYFTLKK
jgi:hypothetical protein